MIRVFTARRLNHIMGGNFISPFEVDDLPDSVIDAILMIETAAEYKNDLEQVEDVFNQWRQSHARK